MKEINKKSYNLMLRALSTFGNEVFTSNKFTDACRDWGVSSYMLTSNNNTRTKFLHTHCLQLGGSGSKTWKRRLRNSFTPVVDYTKQIKSSKGQPIDRVTLRDTGDFHASAAKSQDIKVQAITPALNEGDCIEFLKSLGYKIYKTIEL